MKRKDDFVTNSSSCAFIFIGWKIEQNMENAMRIANLYNVNTQITDNPEDVLQEVGSQTGVDIIFGDVDEQGLTNGFIYIGKTTDIDTDDPYDLPFDQGIVEGFEDKVVEEFGIENARLIASIRMC